MKPTLLILAAGMGTRYGGLKQMDAFGPNGESIIHYSVYDALRAGFGKIIFVIREDFKTQFVAWLESTFPKNLNYELVYQAMDFGVADEHWEQVQQRVKPLGTGHAILCAKDRIKEPFATINGDDYYGVQSFKIMADWLSTKASPSQFSMMGYSLEKTLSPNGTVSRGICHLDSQNRLKKVEEHTKIQNQAGVITDSASQPVKVLLKETPVSMNFWGFHPTLFKLLHLKFNTFLEKEKTNLKSEFFIPFVIDELIQEKKVQVEVLGSPSHWFGVTYAEDKNLAIEKLNQLIEQGVYPTKLWQQP